MAEIDTRSSAGVIPVPWHAHEVPRPVVLALLALASPVWLSAGGALLAGLAVVAVVPGVGVTVALFPSVLTRGWLWWQVTLAIGSGVSLWLVFGACAFRLVAWCVVPPGRIRELRKTIEGFHPFRETGTS